LCEQPNRYQKAGGCGGEPRHSITEIIDLKIKEATAGAKAAGPVHGGINMLTPAEGWVGKAAAAEHFNVSQRTFYSWMKKGVIPYVRRGRSVRFQLSAVDEAINRRVGSAGRY
jgi:excisionase family DNA binding protein